MAKPEAHDSDDLTLQLLVESTRLYEAYAHLNAGSLGQIENAKEPQQAPYADWAHPIGLVLNSAA